ncbi:hypothetical protein BDZ94DRAFT_1363702 [Collybia nuda]|uniref:Uncharacterized protein n=1 Tax=Collybia nuda TaxID=64659 RepID=A0A9P6C847_9AGAR|nr:hypothetical protein BDZ94DRAFT_1363702 [Collybia nuda]
MVSQTADMSKGDSVPINQHTNYQHTATILKTGLWKVEPSPYKHLNTGNRFLDLEVTISKGESKSYERIIKGYSIKDNGDIIAQVKTYGCTNNTMSDINIKDLREVKLILGFSSNLPVEKACLIPRKMLKAAAKKQILSHRATTPTDFEGDAGPSINDNTSSAWNPASRTPEPPEIQTSKHRGAWLMDKCLLNRRLDIKITGTNHGSMVYGGRYENHTGFTVLTRVHLTPRTSITVKLGPNQSKMKFELQYIEPLVSNIHPTSHIKPPCAGSIVREVGRRVVIIGPDYYGNDGHIGKYAIVGPNHPNYPAPDNMAPLCIVTGDKTEWGYYYENDLYSSDIDVVMWGDKPVSIGHVN